MGRPWTPSRRGFTLIDLLVTLTIIAVVASLVLPTLKDDARLRLIGASRMVASDIELAQMMTIANPEEPTVVRFQTGTGEYWLAAATTPDTPIDRAQSVFPGRKCADAGRNPGAGRRAGCLLAQTGPAGD
jgi:prepilin-type N-terminal cleavage/methylation domain-containing protein